MYTQIKQLKELGYSQRKASQVLGIHRKTVKRYWDMELEEYNANAEKIQKLSYLDNYREVILNWITKHPGISSAQICDWLKENYIKDDFKERTVSRYVKRLRSTCNLPKTASPREFTAVEEIPPGQQMQVDFGEKYMLSVDGKNRVKVRFAAFVLSHSRYKYLYFQSRPFCTVDLITAMRECFKFYGGMPKEIVFDQDSIVCVSENNGDIIYTSDFEKFRQQCKFSVYMCRGADPQSKGKIENVVRYVKYGFLENRIYPEDDCNLNALALSWLSRTANAKTHGTTRKIPAEVFAKEREYLLPVPISEDIKDTNLMRTVHKDNTVCYCGNRYSVPIGTYTNQKEVLLEIDKEKLKIYTVFHDFICEHTISENKGILVKNTSHNRDTSKSVISMRKKLGEVLDNQAEEFLDNVYKEKQRYARDQFKAIFTLYDIYGKENLLEGVKFCTQSRLYSAGYLKDFLEYSTQMTFDSKPVVIENIPVDKPIYHTKVEKRSLDIYAKAGAK